MASNLKVDIVRPTATNGSLSLKGDSGGSATANGITVNSSGNTSITGTTTVSQLNAGDGAASTPSITNTGDTDTGLYFPADNTVGVSTGGTERMRIASSGRVGIGTTSPVQKLELNENTLSGGPYIQFENRGSDTTHSDTYNIGGMIAAAYRDVANPSNVAGIWFERVPGTGGLTSGGVIVFGAQYSGGTGLPTECMRIDSNGNVRADKFTNLAGTGAPSFPQGINAANMVGMVCAFAMNSAPTGWLACDGSAISRTTYSDLFTAISTNWGAGDGSTTFNLPDLRGAFLRGSGSHGTETMADTNAFAGPSVGSFENDQFQNFKTDIKYLGTRYGISSDYSLAGVYPGIRAGGGILNGFPIADGQGAPRTGDETRPFNAGILYCIKF